MTNDKYMESAFLLPDLIEIQRSSFRWFLEEGLIEELNSFKSNYRLHWQTRTALFRK